MDGQEKYLILKKSSSLGQEWACVKLWDHNHGGEREDEMGRRCTLHIHVRP